MAERKPAGGKNGDELNDQQRRFVEAYMGKCAGNAARAYMEAYGTEDVNQAAAHASRLIRVGKVKAAIDERVAADPLVASRYELQRRLTAIALGEDRGETLIDEDTGKRVDRWGSKVADEIRAAELLLKTRAELIDKSEVSGPGGKPIETKATHVMTADELVAKALRLHQEREANSETDDA